MTGALHLADGHLFSDKTRDNLIEAIPSNSTCAIALVEHVWAKPLKAAIARAGGFEVDNEWLRLDELVDTGRSRALGRDDADSEEDGSQD